MVFIKYIVALVALSFIAPVAFSGDSTGAISNPSVVIQTVAGGSPCSGVGAIAQTSAGAYATCQAGVWTTRNISNPVYIQATGFIGSFDDVSIFVACPAGKRLLFSSCLVYAPTGTFYHDDQGPAGGVDPNTNFQLPGDTGVYCYYISDTGASGYVVPQGICGDQ